MVRVVRPERTLYGFSNRSLCRLGYTRVEDQVGLEPTKLAHLLKRQVPLPLGALVRECGGCGRIRTCDGARARGIKNPVPSAARTTHPRGV